MKITYIKYLGILLGLISPAVLSGCSNDIEPGSDISASAPGPAVIYASIGNNVEVTTRAVTGDDGWSVATFGPGDVAGMYAVTGQQNPANESQYNQPVDNGKMYYEGKNGNYFRFGNSEIILDPTTVASQYSLLYYPYYAEMPDPTDNSDLQGLTLREDNNGIEKCIDFMETSLYMRQGNRGTVPRLPLTQGVIQPAFYHYMAAVKIIRGAGFENPVDPRIWVVMEDPYTDIRIKRGTGEFTYNLQYHPESGDPVVELVPGEERTSVNKYRAWQCWQTQTPPAGEPNTYPNYAIIPPTNVAYLLLQDNNGVWQRVSSFDLAYQNTQTKQAYNGHRYTITVVLEEDRVIVRPVIVENWNDPETITDFRQKGIENEEEFYEWVYYYNQYVANNRSEANTDKLLEYGDRTKNEATGESLWTFYINNDLVLNNRSDYHINRLDDVLAGFHDVLQIDISNLKQTFIGEIGEKGVLQNVSFSNLNVESLGDNSVSYVGGIATSINGGTVKNCTVYGTVYGDKPVGMLAGSISEGTVTNCKLSGFTIGPSTDSGYQGVFGKVEVRPIIYDGNNTKELYFDEK